MSDPGGILADGIGLAARGDHAAARAMMERAATAATDWDEPWMRIGQSLRAERRPHEACAAYDTALARNPLRLDTLLARGVLALDVETPEAALPFLLLATEIAPEEHRAWHALAFAHAGMWAFDKALLAIGRACALAPDRIVYAIDFISLADRHPGAGAAMPDWPDAVRLAIDGCRAVRRSAFEEAADALEAAMALQPDDPDILKPLAGVYSSLFRPEQAETLLREAHRLAPDDQSIINDWAVTLGHLYRFAEAEAVMAKLPAAETMPVLMRFNRATIRASMGDFEGSRHDIEAASGRADACSALRADCALLPYRGNANAGMLLDAMTLLGAAMSEGVEPVQPPRAVFAKDRDRRLRIGLLSNSLRQHPVGWLTFAGFAALDRSAFSLHCFGHYEATDTFAPWFRDHAESWHNIDGMKDRALAAFIAAQEIDILIDLGGYGDGGRLAVLAHRAAPVQMKWVGSQASTTGMKAVDWFITDRWETPPGYERFYTERLLRLDDGYVCYMPPPTPVAVSTLPALERGHVTFGCYNNLSKLTDDTLRLWGRLFERLPTARLSLRCPQFSEAAMQDRFVERAMGFGFDPARMELRGRATHPIFIAGYRDIDVALDPVPYSGGLTTCEALYMGVPVITLAGDFFAARHSASHISNVGVEGCIAETADGYIEKAMAMAADLNALAALRAGLRDRILASPLCDAPRFGRSLGKALRHAWHDYQAAALFAPA
ncbi:MAG: O-linked N-acetylglucosamine transferase, SPINDLY family protein [Acidiphilium sp.]